MNNLEQEKLFKLYTLAELTYQNHFKDLGGDNELFFQKEWYKKGNYKQKIEIIGEAIKQNELIQNTKKYKEYIKIIKDR